MYNSIDRYGRRRCRPQCNECSYRCRMQHNEKKGGRVIFSPVLVIAELNRVRTSAIWESRKTLMISVASRSRFFSKKSVTSYSTWKSATFINDKFSDHAGGPCIAYPASIMLNHKGKTLSSWPAEVLWANVLTKFFWKLWICIILMTGRGRVLHTN
jgi:hypothetical protein